MRVKTIVNPYANRWKAQRRIPAIQDAFAAADVEHVIVITTEPLQAIEEARIAATQGFDVVVAAGGDGTVNEVANGLVQAAGDRPTIPLAILPIGTGNDLSEMLPNPSDPDTVAQMIIAGKTRQLDIGRCNDRYFTNNCAIAMEAMVTIENIKVTKLKGKLRYMAALAISLTKLKAWEMNITWDDGAHVGPTMLVSVCNGPRTGGQFMMAPSASVDDGFFDVVLLPGVSKPTVVQLLLKLLRGGKHLQDERVMHFQTRTLTVTSKPGTPIHADGELIAEAEPAVNYTLLPGKLTLLTP